MIEIEKKFDPTEEQLKNLLLGADFLGEVTNHDIYYDYSDYRLFKNKIRLRNRNGSFELKIKKGSGAMQEIEDEEEIKKYFETDLSLEEFIEKNLLLLSDYKTKRRKYKKENFNIDIDECDFGYNMCEIEMMIEDNADIEEARQILMNFALKNGLLVKEMPPKGKEYLRLKKPEVYQEIFGAEK